jgi:hypothetical protein
MQRKRVEALGTNEFGMRRFRGLELTTIIGRSKHPPRVGTAREPVPVSAADGVVPPLEGESLAAVRRLGGAAGLPNPRKRKHRGPPNRQTLHCAGDGARNSVQSTWPAQASLVRCVVGQEVHARHCEARPASTSIGASPVSLLARNPKQSRAMGRRSSLRPPRSRPDGAASRSSIGRPWPPARASNAARR